MYSKIVVGTDGSSTADEAVRHALDLAVAGGAELHLVGAYRSAGPATRVGTEAEHWYVDNRTRIDTVLDSAAALARSRGLEVETHSVEDDPGDAILHVAEDVEADAIVVGNKGMHGPRRLLGSVPNKVAHNAPCTVIIVKTT